MKVIFSQKFKREMAIIQPGEYYVGGDYIINTLLGTCVSVVLYSETHKVGGMNHYMLPYTSTSLQAPSGRYGLFAMELLINEFIKKNIPRSSLKAKVFGGGKVLDTQHPESQPHVGTKNVEFVLDYLKREDIPIVSQDLGGIGGRKIYFFPWTGKVLVSRIRSTTAIVQNESKYEKDLQSRTEKIVLFDKEDI